MPIYMRQRVMLAELETTYAVDPTPTGAANAMLAKDIQISPMEGDDLSRDLDFPHMAAQPTIPVNVHSKISFKVELAPSGTAGAAPAWGPLLRACAVAQTVAAGVSVTYNPVSDGHESAHCYFYVGSTLYRIKGMRGNCVLKLDAGGIPYLEFEFTGLFTMPSEASRPAAVTSAFRAPDHVASINTALTINAVPMIMRSFSLDFGNAVEPRFLVGDEGIMITDRADMIKTQVEALPLTTFNPFALAAAQTDVPLILQHGTAPGRIATLNVPKALMQRPTGLEEQQGIKEWPLSLVPLPGSGNDQWTLVLT